MENRNCNCNYNKTNALCDMLKLILLLLLVTKKMIFLQTFTLNNNMLSLLK